MLEFALVAYVAIALFFFWMARSENRRKGQSNTLLTVVLSVAWPVLLLLLALHLIGTGLRKRWQRRKALPPIKFETKRSS